MFYEETRATIPELSTHKDHGPVVQSIISLTSSLRGQLVKCFTILQPNSLKFLSKNGRSFCSSKASHIFSAKIFGIFQILTFEILTSCKINEVVTFEQLGPCVKLNIISQISTIFIWVKNDAFMPL